MHSSLNRSYYFQINNGKMLCDFFNYIISSANFISKDTVHNYLKAIP